jgi:hypothetical protein
MLGRTLEEAMAGFKNECWKWLVVGWVCTSACGGPTVAVDGDDDAGIADAGDLQMGATGSSSSQSGSSGGAPAVDAGVGCIISGGNIPGGTVDPSNPCLFCDPVSHLNSWSHFPDGTTCANGQVCQAGVCAPGCLIGGSVYKPGAAEPGDACHTCNPVSDAGSWSNSQDGMTCASGQVCQAGSCAPGCFIGGTFYPPGADPSNDCQSCDPSVSTQTWTPEANDTACTANGGNFCSSGVCVPGCLVSGTLYSTAQPAAANDCQICTPSESSTSFTAAPDGTACNQSGTYCRGGYCENLCDIQGALIGDGIGEYKNQNACCNTALSTTAWTPAFEIIDGGTSLPGWEFTGGIALADLNNDGIPDLVVLTGNAVEFATGSGNGTFSFNPLNSVSITYPVSLQVADVNGDGFPDVVVLAADPFSEAASVVVLLNAGTPGIPGFSSTASYSVPFPVASFVIGNFVAAGSRDIAVLGNNISTGQGEITVLPNQGNGTYGMPNTTTFTSLYFSQAVAGQFTGGATDNLLAVDSTQDIVAVLSYIAIPFGFGSGYGLMAVSQPTTVPAGSLLWPVVADLNQDGLPDLVASDFFNDQFFILMNTGAGTFNNIQYFGVASPGPIAIGDFNGDGFPDIAVENSGGSVEVFMNETTVGSMTSTLAQPASYPASLLPPTVGDLTGNGTIDMVGLGPSGEITTLLGVCQ